MLGDLKPLCRDKLLIVVDLDELCPATSVWWKKKAMFQVKKTQQVVQGEKLGVYRVSNMGFSALSWDQNLEMELKLFFICRAAEKEEGNRKIEKF